MQSYAIMALEFCYFFIFYFHMIIINDLRVFNASEVHVGSFHSSISLKIWFRFIKRRWFSCIHKCAVSHIKIHKHTKLLMMKMIMVIITIDVIKIIPHLLYLNCCLMSFIFFCRFFYLMRASRLFWSNNKN